MILRAAGGRRIYQINPATHTFHQLHGGEAGETGIDDNVAARGFVNIWA